MNLNVYFRKLCLSELKVYYENLKSNIEAKLNEITKVILYNIIYLYLIKC